MRHEFRERERESKALARELLQELEHMRLVVLKWRSGDGWVRGPISQNPPWYQNLCRQHERGRKRYPKPRTIIKRINTVKALRRVIQGRQNGYVYDERISAVLAAEMRARFG